MKKLKAVIITAQGFQDEEFVYPYYRLLEEGFEVDIATKDKVNVIGKYGVPSRANISTDQLGEKDYDLVVLPGGFEAPDRLRILPEVLAFVRKMDADKKCVAAICHGPWVLISAEVVRGRRMTAFWSIEADVRNAGAVYLHKEPVVVDGNLITSPHYNNNGDFMKAVVAWFKDK